LKVHEVSPCLSGAGVATRTLSAAKDDDPAREAALVEKARFSISWSTTSASALTI
jgi:hypothetical protein